MSVKFLAQGNNSLTLTGFEPMLLAILRLLVWCVNHLTMLPNHAVFLWLVITIPLRQVQVLLSAYTCIMAVKLKTQLCCVDITFVKKKLNYKQKSLEYVVTMKTYFFYMYILEHLILSSYLFLYFLPSFQHLLFPINKPKKYKKKFKLHNIHI